MTRLEEQIGRATSAWVDGARRRAVPVIGLALLVTLASVTFTIRNLGMNTDTEAMLASDLPFRETRAELDAAFPVLLDNFYIVIDARGSARTFQRRLRSRGGTLLRRERAAVSRHRRPRRAG
jgi:hypothetical protein